MRFPILKLPEYYLLVLSILAGYSPPNSFNPFFVAITLIVLLQIILNKRFFGLCIGIVFFLLNLYFLGALISEFSEFSEFTIVNYAAMKLIIVGLFIWTLNTIASGTIIYNYSNSRMKLGFKLTSFS